MSRKPFVSILVESPSSQPGVNDTIFEIALDVCKARRYRYGASITDFPIESGSSMSDHRRKSPDAVEIEGMVSGSPLSSVSTVASMELRGDAQGNAQPASPGPMQTAHDLLHTIHEKDLTVTIVTEYRTHEDMALESLDIQRDAKTGVAFDFTATFKHVTIVSTRSASLPPEVVKKLKKRPKVSEDEKKRKLRFQQFKKTAFGGNAGAVDPSSPTAAKAQAASGAVK